MKITATKPVSISIELYEKLIALSLKTGKSVKKLIEEAVLKGLGK